MYLLLGRDRALLLDTGAHPDPGDALPIRETVDGLLDRWASDNGLPLPALVVAHSHGHGDHAEGDQQFRNRPETRIVGTDAPSVHTFFGLGASPDGSVTFDLGGRTLTLLAIPGHQEASIAFYDPGTQTLLTGDTLYPGILVVEDWPAFRSSADRLAAFAQEHPVRHVLGAHIEAKSEARKFFVPRTRFHPNERRLELDATHIALLARETARMGPNPMAAVTTDHFVIQP